MSCNCGTTGLGSYLGKVGGQAGDLAQNWGMSKLSEGRKRIREWTGLGDYKLSYNSLISGAGSMQAPAISTSGRGVRVRYREYLGEISTSSTAIGDFNITSYRINPADVFTFPWMAPIAQQFDQYKPHGVLFEFRSTATDYSGTTASLGSVIMATDYDVLDAPFSSKSDMLNCAYSQESRMSESAVHGVECDPDELQRRVFYTRPTNLNSSTESRDYDLGTFYVATMGGGLPAGQTVGSLYVHYEFELFKEQVWGGIPSRNQLFSVRSLPTRTGIPIIAFLHPGNISGGGALIGGSDLGITAIQGEVGVCTFVVPKKWAGAHLKYTTRLEYPGVSTFVNNVGTISGLTVVQPGWDPYTFGTPVGTTGPFSWAVQGQDLSQLEMYLAIDSFLQEDAFIRFTEPYGAFTSSTYAITGEWSLLSDAQLRTTLT